MGTFPSVATGGDNDIDTLTTGSSSSSLAIRTPLPLPTELMYEIISTVITDSLHTVCISDIDHPWEFRAIWTLSSVSYWIREITLELVAKFYGLRGVQQRCIPS
jgi:hypothetical protein